MKLIYKKVLAILLTVCALSAQIPAARPQQIVQPGDRTSGQSESTLTLAADKKALVPIVIAVDASENLKATAQYLSERLNKLSGAEFEVSEGDGSRGIVLGTIQQFPVAALQEPLETRPVIQGADIKNGVEAFGIRTEAGRVLLLGGGELGASHAAARFLELLGYRQFYPSPEWEIAPLQIILKFNRNETDRPSVPSRNIWFAFGLPSEPYVLENVNAKPEERLGPARKEIPAWYRQNRQGQSFTVYAAHNYATIVHNNKDAFAAHPEYYALIDGKRSPRTICLSEPAVQRMASDLAVAYFEKYPDRDMYSMEPGDGNAQCQCDRCQAMGSYSNRIFNLANIGARALQQKAPGKMIGLLAYNYHDVPPDFALEPNVHVQVARLFIQSGNNFRELVDMWSEKTRNLGIYDYFSTYQWGQDRLRPRAAAGPTGDLALLTGDIPYLTSKGVLSLWSESSVAWGAHGRGKLVATRLMWNPQTDVNAVLQDFYETAFGPAAPAMKRYFERVDGENELFSKTLVALAFRDVDEAARLAKDRPDVLARIDHLKQFLIYNYYHARYNDTRDEEERKKWILERLTHEFRTRYSYMTHWHAQMNYINDVAKRWKEPTWALPGWQEVRAAAKDGRKLDRPPWLVWEPYTPAETEKKFQEALNYLQPQTLLLRAEYSDDLVPVEFADAPAPLASRQSQSSRATIHLYSLAGEPLEITIKSGKFGDAIPYILHDSKGATIKQSEIPQDEQEHPLILKVPAAGHYRLTYGNRGWWSYAVPPERINTLLLPQNPEHWNQILNGIGGRAFFYVPRGTKLIQFYWSGGDHSIVGPDNKVIEKVTTVGDFVTINVPEGMDGKPWSFTGRLDVRQFINVPSYVAPSPTALLIPREVAVRDGLKIKG